MNSTLKQKSIDTRMQPFPALYPGISIRDFHGRWHHPNWRDALSISRIWHLRIPLTSDGQTLRDLMLHGY